MSFILRRGPSAAPLGTGKRAERIRGIITRSHMEVFANSDDRGLRWLLIRCHGECARLPSTSNNRLMTVPRFHILRTIDWLINQSNERTIANLLALKTKVQNLRGMMTKNPTHVEQLDALTAMWDSLTASKNFRFPFEAGSRGIVLGFLGPDMNRHDSHNIPKAVLDWLQEREIFPNDRHVDSFFRRKTDHGIDGQSSDIIVYRYDVMLAEVNQMFSRMIQILKMVEGKDGTIKPAQQSLLG